MIKNKNSVIVVLIGLSVIAFIFSMSNIANTRRMKENSDGQLKVLLQEKEAKDRARILPLKAGDIIFQTSQSTQSNAIQLATHSKYSHCGIVFKYANDFFVYEATKTVSLTALEKWIARGQDGQFVVKRLKNDEQILSTETLMKLNNAQNKFYKKEYDKYFSWTDNQIYCSELVWKMYRDATGLQIGNLQQLRDFDLTSTEVKEKIKERYGENIPLNDTVISPVSIFNSDLLKTVLINQLR